MEPVESSPFVPDSAADTSLDGGFLQLLREPREPLTVTSPVSPMVADTSTPTEGPDSQRETLPIPSISPILPTGAVHADPDRTCPGRGHSTHAMWFQMRDSRLLSWIE